MGEKTGASCTNSSKPGPKGALRAGEREFGIDRTEAQRSIKIASLSPEAKEAAQRRRTDDPADEHDAVHHERKRNG